MEWLRSVTSEVISREFSEGSAERISVENTGFLYIPGNNPIRIIVWNPRKIFLLETLENVQKKYVSKFLKEF